MKDNNFYNYINILSDKFEKDFSEIYKSLSVKNKSKILDYIPDIFGKWCCSAMFEDTVFTPYIMIENLNNLRTEKKDIIFPAVSSKCSNRYCGLEKKYVKYSIDNHPIVSDLLAVLDIFTPTVECGVNGFIKDEYCKKAFDVITIKSYGYLEYLFYICIHLDLINDMPSLFTEMYSVNTKKKNEFISKGKKENLNAVVNAGLELFAESINAFMPEDEVYIDSEFVLEYFKNPSTTDTIIADIYDLLDIDIAEIFEKKLSEIDEYDSLLLSTFYTLGTILDKSFFTPFSTYFHFIQPMFIMPLDLMREIDIILASDIKYEAVDMLLMPAHRYTSTYLAAEYFDLDHIDKYEEIFNKMPVTYILNNLDDGIESFKQVKSLSKPKIYSFKINCPNAKDSFLIELEETNTLSDLHRTICQAYSISYFSDYSFFMSEEVSPFLEYTPVSYNKNKHNKTEKTYLNTINFDKLPNFFYCNYNNLRPKKTDISDCFNISYVDKHLNNTSFVYPRTIKFYGNTD